MKLFIANKKYSSWSFRPWFAARMASIEFEEILVPFNDDGSSTKFKEFSPTGKVPCLVDGGVTIWESLAILEYLADKYPEKHLWPQDTSIRAVARAVAHEMHGGFGHLRNECPMNMDRTPGALKVSDGVRCDVNRVEEVWDRCLQKSGGPFFVWGIQQCGCDVRTGDQSVGDLSAERPCGSEFVYGYHETNTGMARVGNFRPR